MVVVVVGSVRPSRFCSADDGTREMLCIHVTLPLASHFKINCLWSLTGREGMGNAAFRERVLEEL